MEKSNVRPRRVQSHCTAAPPISVGVWREDIGMGSIASPAMICDGPFTGSGIEGFVQTGTGKRDSTTKEGVTPTFPSTTKQRPPASLVRPKRT